MQQRHNVRVLEEMENHGLAQQRNLLVGVGRGLRAKHRDFGSGLGPGGMKCCEVGGACPVAAHLAADRKRAPRQLQCSKCAFKVLAVPHAMAIFPVKRHPRAIANHLIKLGVQLAASRALAAAPRNNPENKSNNDGNTGRCCSG